MLRVQFLREDTSSILKLPRGKGRRGTDKVAKGQRGWFAPTKMVLFKKTILVTGSNGMACWGSHLDEGSPLCPSDPLSLCPLPEVPITVSQKIYPLQNSYT